MSNDPLGALIEQSPILASIAAVHAIEQSNRGPPCPARWSQAVSEFISCRPPLGRMSGVE